MEGFLKNLMFGYFRAGFSYISCIHTAYIRVFVPPYRLRYLKCLVKIPHRFQAVRVMERVAEGAPSCS